MTSYQMTKKFGLTVQLSVEYYFQSNGFPYRISDKLLTNEHCDETSI